MPALPNPWISETFSPTSAPPLERLFAEITEAMAQPTRFILDEEQFLADIEEPPLFLRAAE